MRGRILAKCAGAVALLLAVASDEAVWPPTVPSSPLLEMRHDNVVVQEWDLSCGAAALATILNHQYDDPVSEREIAAGLIRRDEYLGESRSRSAAATASRCST